MEQLVQIKAVFSEDTPGGVKSLCWTIDTHQFHIHEHLQKSWVTFQKLFGNNIGLYI